MNATVDLKGARREEKEFESATVQGGIIGVTGTGKSSLINALAGRDIAEVGVGETTGVVSEISTYEFHNIILIDLPGVGTRKWRTQTYFSNLAKRSPLAGKYLLRPRDFDFFIIVLANRILDEDLKLYRLISGKLKKRCFLVRSKFDIDANNNWRTKRRTDKQTHREIRADVWRNFPKEKRDRVFVVSTAEPARGDFEQLEAAIMKSLPKVKAEKFLAFAMTYTEQGLKKKRIVSEKIAGRMALLSASNAFNPIPGLGIAVDVGLLLKLSRDLVTVYGLTPAQLEHECRLHQKSDAWGIHLKRKVMSAVESLLTTRGIVSILRQLGHGLGSRELTKWIPYIGLSIAAAMGYRLTSSYAQEAISRCEAQALRVVKEVTAQE